MTDPRLNAPLRELLNGISTDVQLLASQTLTLARLEVSTAASKLAWSAAGLLASVLVTVAGAAVLVSALVLILIALGLPAWAASTLVGVTLTGAGAIAANYFVGSIRSAELGMKETRESLRETMEWLKLQTGA
jgi:ABC-type uncharacterized transport system permease subunit